MDKKIIMLSGKSETTTFMFNALNTDYPITKVIIEGTVSKKKFLKNRIKKLGYITVFGQVLFQLTVPKILTLLSKKRIEEIKSNYNIDSSPIPDSLLYKVDSVNSIDCINFIKKENPDLIIVNGTRIISKDVLNCTDAIFINTHAGITPKYRGVHGAYWALVNNDLTNCGVTVHLVDSGIDTGGILYQQTISPTAKDNFITYTYLQIGEGIILMQKAVNDFVHNQLKEHNSKITESKLWYHPTIWFYIYKKLAKSVK